VRKLILALMLSLLLLSYGSAMAATSAFENLPGGAGVTYFECNNGWQTIMNIQNTTSNVCGDSAVVVHITFYDQNSNDIMDFDVPLSARDNWGASITCDGAQIVSTPDTPVVFAGGAYTGAEVRTAPYAGNFGYVVAVITGVDNCAGLCNVPIGAVCAAPTFNDGDPRNDRFTALDAYLPDSIFVRSALINVTQGVAYALNAQMLQGFANIATLNEGFPGVSDFWDSVTDAPCIGVDWNNNGTPNVLTPGENFVGNDDGNGVVVDTWEIYITNNWFITPTVVADNPPANVGFCPRNGRAAAVGSGNNTYWARYNEDPAAGSETSLIVIFPANTGTGNVGGALRDMGFVHYNDNEDGQTQSVTPAEVDVLDWGPELATNGTTGESRITVAAPMFGFSYTIVGTFADLYPVVRERANYLWTNTALTTAHGFTVDGTASEVLQISSE